MVENEIIERAEKARAGRSIRAFAEFLGMSQRSLTAYMNGERKPSVEFVFHICDKCNISADWLLGLSSESKSERNPANESEVEIKLAQAEARIAKLEGENEALRFALQTIGSAAKSAPPTNRATAS